MKTRETLLEAAEHLLMTAGAPSDVTTRRIARLAGVQASAVNYHFTSLHHLIVEAIERIYLRLNAERLRLLQEAIDEQAPRPPRLDNVIAALIGPSVRWSLDSGSGYCAFVTYSAIAGRSSQGWIDRTITDHVEHLQAFVPPLQRAAPHLSENQIAWRIHCILGIRTQVTRMRARAEALLEGSFDLNDPERVIREAIDVIVPMFRA